MVNRCAPRHAGFTLIELILVLILVGILSVYVIPRFFNRNTFDTRSFGDEMQSMVRYAQKAAIAQNRNVFAVFSNGNRNLALCFDGACNTAVLSPSSKPATMVLPASVSIAISPSISGFYFNALGRPFNTNDVDPVSTFILTTITLDGGGFNRVTTVEPETGSVHAP